jgi:uncharacterized protein (DUF736 family)
MATNGTFTEEDGKLVGKIQTLSINSPLTLLPNGNQSSPDGAHWSGRARTAGTEMSEAAGTAAVSARYPSTLTSCDAPKRCGLFGQTDALDPSHQR